MNKNRDFLFFFLFLGSFWLCVFLFRSDYLVYFSTTWLQPFVVGEETPPKEYTRKKLSYQELRYCLHEGKRLDYLKDIVDFTLARRYNEVVEDYNSRCQYYAYDYDEKFAIEKRMETLDQVIYSQALERIKAWRREEADLKNFRSPYYAIASGIFLLDITKPQHAKIVQRRLWELGYFAGPINEYWQKDSTAALINFKDNNGLAPTPTWDMASQQFLFGTVDIKSRN